MIDCSAPKAKEFRSWVTTDVLPTIRKTGQYSTQQVAPAPTHEGAGDKPSSAHPITLMALDELDSANKRAIMAADALRASLSSEAELATQLGYNGYYTQAQIRQCNHWMGASKVHITLNALSSSLGHEIRCTQNYGTTVQHNMYAVEVWEAYAASLGMKLAVPEAAKNYAKLHKYSNLRLRLRLHRS